MYLRSTEEMLDKGDAELATVELQGALSLLQQTVLQQRRKQLDQQNVPPAEPALELAAQHEKRAKELVAAKQWEAAATHYQTMLSLLQVGIDRGVRRLNAESAAFNRDYSADRETIQKWYDEAQKDPKLTTAKRTGIQQQYQDKLRELEDKWRPKREAFNKRMEELRQQVDKQRTDLTKRRCEVFTALADIYKAKGQKQQASYYATMAYQEMSRTLERNQDFAGAEAEYRKWLKARPDDPTARIGLARCLEQEGKSDQAAAEYRAVLKKNPKDTNTRFQLAALLGRHRKWDEAIGQWKQIIQQDRENLKGIKGKGAMAESRRRYVKSQLASHYWQLATVCQQAKKTKDAKAAYRKAVELNPGLKASVPAEYKS